MSKKLKMQQLNSFVQIEAIDFPPHDPDGGHVYGLIPLSDNTPAHFIINKFTAEQLSSFAQTKFGFGINFIADEATYVAIQEDIYTATDRCAMQFEAAGIPEREAWNMALNKIQHMSFAKPADQWTTVPK